MTGYEGIASAAASYIGTPYQHQGRNRAGLDCVGLVVTVCEDLNLLSQRCDFSGRPVPLRDLDYRNYSREPAGHILIAQLQEHFDSVSLQDAMPGDLLLFRILKEPQHLAVVTARDPVKGLLFTHAYQPARKVICSDMLGARWQRRFVSAWRFRASAFSNGNEG